MNVITEYECEVCKARFKTPDAALRCEAQGPGIAYPTGMIFNNASHPTDFYRNMTFAIAKVHVQGHYVDAGSWACRDNSYGDNLNELCSVEPEGVAEYNRPDPNHPTFKRMVDAIRAKGIEPTVWDGAKVVTLEEFLGGNAWEQS